MTSMNDKQNDNKVKELGEIFSTIRRHLDDKENELRELKLVQPSLSLLDDDQVQAVISSIKSLHLTTPDGSFLFPSNKIEEEPNRMKPKIEHRLPMVDHLLSLPLDAYLSPRRSRPNEQVELSETSKQTSLSQPENKANVQENKVEKQVENRSLLQSGSVYSRDFWLNKSKQEQSVEQDRSTFDVDKYVEQTNEKIRRLHLEYLSSISSLDDHPSETDPVSNIKSIYPSFFERKKD